MKLNARLGQFLAALLVGGIGGALFSWFAAPLPWLLGSMTLCALFAGIGLPILAPPETRGPTQAVLGVLLGTGFSPAVFENAGDWLISFAMVPLFVATASLVCIAWFRWTTKLDPGTALFAAVPGGIAEMVALGQEAGADTRMIALIHSARIFLVVMILPLLMKHFMDVPIGQRLVQPELATVLPMDLAVATVLLLICAVAGVKLGGWLHLPARYLLGPMLVTAALRLGGIASFEVPHAIIVAAQLGLGASIGCRFAGTSAREILRLIGPSIGSTLLLLILTIAFAQTAAALTGRDPVTLVLAFSPGGTAEMSMIALSAGGDLSAVVAHHLLRLATVTLGAGRVAARLRAQNP